MNYFEMIKAALDASFANICEHKDISSDEAYKAMSRHLQTMNEAWFSGEAPTIAYGDPICRLAYLFCHVAANANLCELAIRNSPDLKAHIENKLVENEEIRICAFGGGPGTELLAFSKYLLKQERTDHVEIVFTLLDAVPEWHESWDALERQIKAYLKANFGSIDRRPYSTSKTFVPFDMTKHHQYGNLSSTLANDVYVMNYVVSEIYGDQAKFQELVNAASDAARPGSKFLVIDRNQISVISDARLLLENAGLNLGNVRESSTNMDSDEQMSSLEDYVARIGRRPRIQWRGAFYLIGTKPE